MSSRRCAGLFVLAILILQIVGVSRAAAELHQRGDSAAMELCTAVSGATPAFRGMRARDIDHHAVAATMRPHIGAPEITAWTIDVASGVTCARRQPSSCAPLASRPPPSA